MASVQTLDEEFEDPESIDDTDDGNTGEDSDLHIETNWIELATFSISGAVGL